MASDDELLVKLGSTNANDRAILERGVVMLPALDAIVADLTQPNARRMSATRLANEIRVRSLAAPAAPAPARIPAGEARAFFAAGGQLRSDHEPRPTALVDALYAAGAVRVSVPDDHSILLVELPRSEREPLFAVYNAQVDEYGEEFGGEELAGHEMTAEEAAKIGMPDAVGDWVVDGLHIADRGQSHLHFWWD